MLEKFNNMNSVTKISIVALGAILLLSMMDFNFSIGNVIGLFVDVILFVVLDVFLAAILCGIDILGIFINVFVSALVMFIGIISGIFAFAGFALLFAIIGVPLYLYLKYNPSQNRQHDADYK